jgi:hypothetical protein
MLLISTHSSLTHLSNCSLPPNSPALKMLSISGWIPFQCSHHNLVYVWQIWFGWLYTCNIFIVLYCRKSVNHYGRCCSLTMIRQKTTREPVYDKMIMIGFLSSNIFISQILHIRYVAMILRAAAAALRGRPNFHQPSTALSKQITICGDLHGKLDDLLVIFYKVNFPTFLLIKESFRLSLL